VLCASLALQDPSLLRAKKKVRQEVEDKTFKTSCENSGPVFEGRRNTSTNSVRENIRGKDVVQWIMFDEKHKS